MKKSHINALDKLWSKKVKELADYKCEHCLETEVWLNACHIIGRRYRATRWLIDNGMCLCFGCHRQYDEHGPFEADIRRRVVGEARYQRLRKIKNVIAKHQDFEQIKEEINGAKRDNRHR